MSSDLGLDPSDPLNLLLHNRSQHDTTQDTDTDSPSTPPDWNSLSSMWSAVEDHKMDFNMDFGGLIDMSFDPAVPVAVEPTALNYNYAVDPFQFTFESPPHSSSRSSDSGSTSGSFSPRAAYSPAASYSPPASEFGDDPATELANRVRKAAGLVLAVPINVDQRQPNEPPPQQQQIFQIQPDQQPPPPQHAPPPFTTAPVPPPPPASTAPAPPPPRPKTSHTTIERRYRTNLNARIQSLRAAVPALRVVDRAAALKAGSPPLDNETEDIVDARGFVDGVKVARKCSKANVLGKAVEYIRVLKNRELRLTRELAGLKTLLSGLVGGRELLAEWEREWAVRFGGPETDEITSENGGGAAEEDGDEDEDDSDDEGSARKRKRAKLDPKPKVERKPPAPVVEGEKKKRGRPRKVVNLPPTAAAPALSTSVPMQPQQPQQHQYLLGAFALFSFFANTPSSPSPSSTPHAHQGHVLTKHLPGGEGGMGLSVLQIFHLFVSVAVLASVLFPLAQSLYARYAYKGRGSPATVSVGAENVKAKLQQEVAEPSSPTSASEYSCDDTDTDLSLSTASLLSDGDGDEAATVCAPSPHLAAAEACILDDSTPLTTRLRTAFHLYTALPSSSSPSSATTTSSFSTTASENADRRLLALLVRPLPLLGHRIAHNLWGDGMGLGIDEAAGRVSLSSTKKTKTSILRALEETLAVERLRGVAAAAFAREVLGEASSSSSSSEEQQHSLADARKLGGPISVLAARVGRVLAGGNDDLLYSPSDDTESESDTEDEDNGEGDVEKLLRAIVLYRRVFNVSASSSPSVVNGNSSSVNGKDAYAQALRRTLGSSDVFEEASVEEARDRIVDLLTGEKCQ
ncbi:BHLH domain-containing protein [Favolaschia claudopus]|uniref:BHLH domain-containing protein n=1 Tax=Favolaschia claudopus TaxID=2862362 RepID=A0AAW0D6X4_9AGAR